MSGRDRHGPPGEGQGSTGKRVTLREVADSLDLSPATVSLVLNRSPVAASIPPATQKRVFAAAEKLGYRPNILARSLRSQRSFSIGVVVPEISEGYASGILSGIEDHLMGSGYFYLVASHRSKADLLDEYLYLLKERLVEGFILVSTPIEEPPGLPAVAVAGHRSLEGVTNVVLDHDRAAHLALSHLADLGHRRIALFKGHPQSADTEDRWQAIRRATRSLGLVIHPELTLQLGGEALDRAFSPDEGYQEGYAYGRLLLDRKADFTALFAFNDVSAIGAMRAFLDSGLAVPGDVSVLGFDDIHGAGFQNPGLTTVRQPLRAMGTAAARILLERLAGASHNGPVTITPELIVRGSTAPATARPRRRDSSDGDGE
ncbi:MAG: LacI family DNA-binding transcriptional regulator [Thermoanaerobaculia bacterium]|nr:LacI family DNA-binding transcriptional regulator [Thermoanaerobaculia bacterium]